VDGKTVKTVRQLIDLLDGYSVGDRVELMIRRDGANKRLPVVLGRSAQGAGGVYMSSGLRWPDMPSLAVEPPTAPGSRGFVSGV
jgi:PDZ domain-containing secreted protein